MDRPNTWTIPQIASQAVSLANQEPMNNLFEHAYGTSTVKLLDRSSKEQQAFNQADHYLLQTLKNIGIEQNIACINDEHGALSKALSDLGKSTQLIHDLASFNHKLKHNNIEYGKISDSTMLHQAQAEVFLLRLPKSLQYFRFLLAQLAQQNSPVVVAGMQKYWPKSFYEQAHAYFDEVDVLAGQKKAKCMILKSPKTLVYQAAEFINDIHAKDYELTLCNYPGVFAADKIDIGSRFLLDNFSDLSQTLATAKTVLDLGAGNGLLSLYALKQHPHLQIHAVDDNKLAQYSCELSLAANNINQDKLSYHHNHCLHELDIPKVDAILCNPPFHQNHQIGTGIAETMIKQSKKQLVKDGVLYLIGNRHLGYHQLLRKQFGKVEMLNSNAKFVLFAAKA